ncbi:MAG: hypothetical protein GYA23_04140 [Methanomicrobiales archaeon]|nr:hypothetical protein [Methanomicrobiales archaeon]
MNCRIYALFALIMSIALVTAGCTGTQTQTTAPSATAAPSQPGQVQTPGAAATTAAAGSTFLLPTEVDALGPERLLNVNIEKDYLGRIHATFQGGPGLLNVRKLAVTVNRADGTSATADLGIKVDDTITLDGTKETDRVIVYASLADGKTYKIYDDFAPFRSR